jgi:hypothetical protein
MRGVISFHPVDPGFFETLVEPLLRGEKVNPEAFLDGALRVRRAARKTRGYKLALARLFEEFEPPPPLDQGTLWDRVRTRLERFDYQAPPLSRVVRAKLEPALHLSGRPFLITEASPERVAELVAEYAATSSESRLTSLVLDQLSALDPALARIVPEGFDEGASDGAYRHELLGGLRRIHDWSQDARARADGADEMPWQMLQLHARAVPFWTARDVDGLGTICEAAGLRPPAALVPATGLFLSACAEHPELYEGLRAELRGPRDIGAYVAPRHVADVLTFLTDHGGRMIQMAARHGQGPLCTLVLRKIRECLRFAERHGVGYLEASGIHAPFEEPAPAEVEAVAPA